MASLNDRVTATIRAELGRRGRRQYTLAEPLGVTPPQVSKRLNGHVPLTLHDLEVIAGVLELPPAYLLGAPDREPVAA